MAQKTLYRSRTNRKCTGLIAGLAEYFDADVNMLRLVAVLLIIFSGIFPGLFVYLVGSAFVPVKPESKGK